MKTLRTASRAVTVVLTGLFFVVGMFAQTNPQSSNKQEVITTLTLESIQHIIQAMGFECTPGEKDDKGKPADYFTFKAEGYKVAVEVPTTGSYVWLFNIFTDKTTPETVNAWNVTNHFSRAYINTDNNLWLDTDIVVQGGVTQEAIENQIKEFRDSVARWARFVSDHQKPTQQQPK